MTPGYILFRNIILGTFHIECLNLMIKDIVFPLFFKNIFPPEILWEDFHSRHNLRNNIDCIVQE